jgi:hypothetical protein
MDEEELIITAVTPDKDGKWISISAGSCGFGLETKYNVVPKVGDTIILHTVGWSLIRGITLNGTLIYYKTDEDLELERLEQQLKYEQEKQELFKKEVKSLDKKYSKLPQVFKDRIDRFRANNDRFRIDFESYELFCCEQAVVIAKACKTPAGVQEFSKMEWKDQMNKVKKLSDDHSGNTFGMSTQLAYWYLEQPDVVTKAHGSLSVLVGSAEYGDSLKTEDQYE